jgi:hypothetical protein
VRSGESTASFLSDADTGRCADDPEGAEVLPRETETRREGDYRYSQALIIAAERIYALGAFRTLSGDSLHLDVREDVKHLLAEWKKDMPKLLERFDLDGNGTLDLREGQLARAQARREVERNRRELRAALDTHFLSRPADGRLFLISSLPPEKIERRYLLLAIASRGVLRRLVGCCALLVGGISWGSSALQPRCPRVIQFPSQSWTCRWVCVPLVSVEIDTSHDHLHGYVPRGKVKTHLHMKPKT